RDRADVGPESRRSPSDQKTADRQAPENAETEKDRAEGSPAAAGVQALRPAHPNVAGRRWRRPSIEAEAGAAEAATRVSSKHPAGRRRHPWPRRARLRNPKAPA